MNGSRLSIVPFNPNSLTITNSDPGGVGLASEHRVRFVVQLLAEHGAWKGLLWQRRPRRIRRTGHDVNRDRPRDVGEERREVVQRGRVVFCFAGVEAFLRNAREGSFHG